LQFVPQDCTDETSGLLYYDLLTAKMYRCTGRRWTEWGWGSTGDTLHYTALLRDSASSELAPPPPAADEYPDDDGDVIAVTSETVRQQAGGGRGRRKSCRPG